MLDIWEGQTDHTPHAGGHVEEGARLLEARRTLRRPLTSAEVSAADTANARYTRDASNEIYRLFHRLPNPDLLMYVFPHLSGIEPVPVPGYSTVFPFYRSVQYALPGEQAEGE